MGIVNKAMRFVGPAVLPKVSNYKGIVDTYTKHFIAEDVQPDTILYESRDGKSLTDSPYAIFDYLLQTDSESKYTHIWVVTDNAELEQIKALYQEKNNVIFVKRNSHQYLKWLTKAQYLINNSTFQPFVTIKDEQTYINTWHGTPLKTMGFDIPGNPADAKNVVRNFFMADYLISPNPHTTEMFLKSYRLHDNYAGKIIETGYPRIDRSLKKNPDDLLRQLFSFNVQLDLGKKILLYSPTVKISGLASGQDEVAQIHEEMSLVREQFGSEYNVLIKVHPFLYAKAKEHRELVPYLIPDVIDTNDLLGIVDCLITDYSSIFFDFLVTGKPILFYCWDDDLYSSKRGKYFTYDELPGPVAFNIKELLGNITNVEALSQAYQNQYQACQDRFTPYDDGQVTKRVVDVIFNQKPSANTKVLTPSDNGKQKLLFYPGGMRSNGITSSFLNLVQNIDYDLYDVVCFLDNISTLDQIKNVSDIPKNITLLFRFDDPIYTAKEHYQDLRIHLKGVKNEDKYPEVIYQREVRRLIGKNSFDVAIDFSGYSLHWSKLVLGIKANKYLCYLHSDMALDKERVVEGRKIHKMNLQGIFSVYKRYDYLVSVSEPIRDINEEKLAQYASKEKFVYATNTLNIDKILGKNEPVIEEETPETELFVRNAHLVNPDQELTVYSARVDTSLGEKQKCFFAHSKVLVLGKFTYEGTKYYKINQDNVYIGWIDAKEVEVEPVSILARESISLFGKLNTLPGDLIYSQPIGLKDSLPTLEADLLRNVYIETKEKVTTQEGTSILVSIDKHELGWLDISKIRPSSKLNRTRNGIVTKSLRWLLQTTNHRQYRSAINSVTKIQTIVESKTLTKELPELDPNQLNIVTTGRLSQEKNQQVLIEAFDLFRQQIPNSHLYIIGSGPEEERLKETIKKLRLENSVTLLGQVYYPFEFMNLCDVFALTSIYEGQSMVLLEALTLNMKCVSTDIPACRNVLKNGAYGLLTETNDKDGIAESLLRIGNQKEDYEKFNPFNYNQESLKLFYHIINC